MTYNYKGPTIYEPTKIDWSVSSKSYVSAHDVLMWLCDEMSVSDELVLQGSTEEAPSHVRAACMYVCCQLMRFDRYAIAAAFGRKKRSVDEAIHRYETQLKLYRDEHELIERLKLRVL